MSPVVLEAAKPLYDKSASWGGPVAAIIASAIFVIFAVWIIVTRVRGDRSARSDAPRTTAAAPPTETDRAGSGVDPNVDHGAGR